MAGRLFRARRGSLRLVAAATPCILLALLWQLGGDESGAAFAVPATGLASAAPEVASTLTGGRAAAHRQLVPRLQAPDASGGGTPSGAAVANVVPPLWVVAFQGLLAYAAMVGGVAASLGSPAAIKGAVGILGMYVIMSVNEYVVHRYYQHLGINRTALSRWLRNMLGMKPFKTSGHMEHHAETLDDMTLDQKPEPILDADPFRGTAFSWSVSAQMTLEIALQSYPFLWLCGWSFTASTAALVAGLSLHAMVWQTLHPAMHLLPDPPITYGFPGWSLAALRQSRYFRFLYANHEGHHRVPGAHGNYNVCFPLADHLFGTYRGYVPPKMAVA